MPVRKFAKIILLIIFFLSASAADIFVYAEWNLEQTRGKHFLWKVASENTTVYILGSVHLAKPDLYPLANVIERAFNDSDILVVEVNINNLDPLLAQQIVMAKGTYATGETLRDNVAEETYQLAKNKLEEFGLDINQMVIFKPWFLAINLVTFALVNLGFDPNYGIDQYFLNKARGSKDILELESFAFQINLFDSFTNEHQELFLLSTLIDVEIIEDEMDEMMDSWKRGDVDQMGAMLTRPLKEIPGLETLYEKLYYERNRNMAAKIEDFLYDGGTYFIVVGAGHLVGHESIIELLRYRGYSFLQL